MAYADYYERALTNGVLSIQRGTEPGVMIYMLPLGPGTSKAHSYHKWGTKFDSFWCCYGTGTTTFSCEVKLVLFLDVYHNLSWQQELNPFQNWEIQYTLRREEILQLFT